MACERRDAAADAFVRAMHEANRALTRAIQTHEALPLSVRDAIAQGIVIASDGATFPHLVVSDAACALIRDCQALQLFPVGHEPAFGPYVMYGDLSGLRYPPVRPENDAYLALVAARKVVDELQG